MGKISCLHIITVYFLLQVCVTGAFAELADWMEFQSVEEAMAFGWKNAEQTGMTACDERKVGRYALRIDAEQGSQEYSGIELVRGVDLSGAKPGDKLVFFVKQNFGAGMTIQLWTEQGNLNRSFEVTLGDWTRVELDMDISQWENPKNAAAWSKLSRLQLYSKSFSSPGQFMIVDGMSISVNGKPAMPVESKRLTDWKFPNETSNEWRLGDDQTAWAISKSTGQVVGGWNVPTKECYLLSVEGRYHLEDRKSLVTALASQDTVTEAKFSPDQQRIELTCSNTTVPDLIINKQYWMRGNKLFQKIAFKTKSDELQFVTYNSQAVFEQSYRDAGYYMGGGDGGWPLIPAPKLDSWQKVVMFQNTTKGMVLHQPDLGYGFAHVRTRLDDTFVWPWFTGAIASYCEPVNIMHYTPDGWDMSLGTSKLSQTAETSYEQYLSIFPGDWQRFLNEEYRALPEVQRALAEIPPTPAWVGDVIADTCANIDRVRRLLETTDEGHIMVLMDFGGSWADYYVDEGVGGGTGGFITGPEIKNLVQRFQSLSPRVKVGMYMWNLSATENTRIYKKHPEWFRTNNKEGQPISTFPGFAPNFAQLLSIPECYDELLRQFDLVLGYLGTDFIYLDDPKAINPIDWASGEFTRDDLSFRFFLDIKKIAAKHGPDKMVFFNNQCNPYADVNYIEARGSISADFWRYFAGNTTIAETNLRADQRICLLYYVTPHERDYVNRVLALGWIPEMAYGDVLARRPFIQTAYEIGNCDVMPVRYSPDWKNDKSTNVESYAVRRRNDDGYLLSFINHDKENKIVPLQLDLSSFDLPSDGPIFVWQHAIEDANTFRGTTTAQMVRQTYAAGGGHPDRVARRKLLYAGPRTEDLKFEIEMPPLLLHQLYVTAQPAGVYSEDGLPSNYIFNQKPNVGVKPLRSDWNERAFEMEIENRREMAEMIVSLPLSLHEIESATLDDREITCDVVAEADDAFARIKVPQGKHVLNLDFRPRSSPSPVAVSAPAAPPPATQPVSIAAVPERMPGQRQITEINRQINGLNVLRSAVLTSDSARGTFQPDLESLMADARVDELTLEAGTTRKIEQGTGGAAFAGLEIQNLRRVRVQLDNTFYNAFHQYGRGNHAPHLPHPPGFAGLLIDYHTPNGYAKRVALATGLLHPEYVSSYPDYGKSAPADESYDLGANLIETPSATFALNLEQYAPPDWDGQVWLSAGSEWAAHDRRLTLKILAVNDSVSGDFLSGSDPRATKAEYDKPKTIEVPRAPGGILIDGMTNEEWWRQAKLIDKFFVIGGLRVSAASTSARLLYDDTQLYVAFNCAEPARDKPLILGSAIWDDDEVEVWIDADGDGQTYHQVIVNAANDQAELTERGPTRIGATSAVRVENDGSWTVEMTIPFAGLGVKPPKPGETWRLSLCRYRPAGKDFNYEAIVWAPLQTFKDLANFGTLIFK